MESKLERIRELLLPLVHEEENKLYSFSEDDLKGVLSYAKYFHVEDGIIQYLEKHPNINTQELYHNLPEGVAPDPEDLEEDWDDDDVDISHLSEYVQLLITRYTLKDMNEEEQNDWYFLIGNPEHMGLEDRMVEHMKENPDEGIVDLLIYYVDHVIPPEYRQKLLDDGILDVIPIEEDD